jgi:hypothetical protein
VIIAIVILELLACLSLTVLIGVGTGGDDVATAPLEVWLACAALQLTVHYLPRGPYARYGLLVTILLMLLVGAMLSGSAVTRYPHQALFIAGIAALPQLWLEWFSRITEARNGLLCLFGLIALPLGYATWGVANIGLVKINAASVAQGVPYCILLSDGYLFAGGRYHNAPNDRSLSGWNMFTGRGAGGSGNCCQWDFHALLLTRDDQLFNWTYRSQRFERVSPQSRRMLRLNDLACP